MQTINLNLTAGGIVVLLLALPLIVGAQQISRERPLHEKKCDFPKQGLLKLEHIPATAIVRKVWPELPKSLEISAPERVSIKVLIDRMGVVKRACAFSGNPTLNRLAEKAASRWRFKPGFGLPGPQNSEPSQKIYTFTFIEFVFKKDA